MPISAIRSICNKPVMSRFMRHERKKIGSAVGAAEPRFLEGCNNGPVNARSIETHFHVSSAIPLPRLTRCAGFASLELSIADTGKKINTFP